MTITQLGDRIAELAARINIATYEMLTLIAEFDRREGWADAFTSCAEWLAWRTGRMIGTCRENVRVAHALEGLPKTSAEMKAGRLSYTKVRAITRAATKETEARLLKYADKCSAAQLERIVRGWKHLSRDGEVTAEEVRHQRRTLSVVIDADGTYVVRGRLEPEAGAVLMRAIEAATDALYRGEDPDARPTNRQRRADAAGLVAERALAAGLAADADEAVQSGTRAERYQVTVHTEMSTLEEHGEGGRSELDGVRVSAETSRRMACDASVVHMMHRDGQVVSVGRKTPGVREPVHRGASCQTLGRRRGDESREHRAPVSAAPPAGARGRSGDGARCEGSGRVLHARWQDARERAAVVEGAQADAQPAPSPTASARTDVQWRCAAGERGGPVGDRGRCARGRRGGAGETGA